MKHKNILTLLMMGFCIVSGFSQVPSYVPTSGLVGWWPFDGNAKDVSSNNNHGTVNGATLTSDRFGKTNSAYSFDGDDNIVANPVSVTNGLTVSCWTKGISLSEGGQIVTQSVYDNPASVTWEFNYLANTSNHEAKAGSYKVMYGTNCTSSGTDEVWHNTLNVQGWNHVVFTVEKNGNTTIYINGVKTAQKSLNPFPGCAPYTGSSLRFGGPWHPADLLYFKGDLDDIGIWNRALTQQEIDDLYKSVNTSSTSNTAFNNTKLYPNPASTHLNLDIFDYDKTLGYNIEILNTTGKSLYNATVLQKTVTIDMSTWTCKGLYFVNIRDTSGKLLESKKFVLQ
jgi:hypothetical protein